MRILFAGERPGYPQRMNGAAVSTHHLAGMLARNGAAVHVLCRRAKDAPAPETGERPRPDFIRYPYTVDRVPDPAAVVTDTAMAFAPDFAVLSAGASVAMAKKLADLGIPIVVYQRDCGFDLLREISTWPSSPLLGVFCCSRFVAARLKKQTGLDGVFLPNVFPRQGYAVEPAGRLVTFVNPVPVKGVDLVLDLAARHRDLAFLFVEGWNLPVRQRALIRRRASRPGNILWHPRTDDMRQVYAMTRVLLMPSQWLEAWGRVATEAQISGIPVLASNRGGLPESVGDGGVLLPAEDIDAWSECLVAVMSDDALWASLSAKAASRSRRAELDPNRIVAEFICLTRDWLRRAGEGKAVRRSA